jgi:hypothetical protein
MVRGVDFGAEGALVQREDTAVNRATKVKHREGTAGCNLRVSPLLLHHGGHPRGLQVVRAHLPSCCSPRPLSTRGGEQ